MELMKNFYKNCPGLGLGDLYFDILDSRHECVLNDGVGNYDFSGDKRILRLFGNHMNFYGIWIGDNQLSEIELDLYPILWQEEYLNLN